MKMTGVMLYSGMLFSIQQYVLQALPTGYSIHSFAIPSHKPSDVWLAPLKLAMNTSLATSHCCHQVGRYSVRCTVYSRRKVSP